LTQAQTNDKADEKARREAGGDHLSQLKLFGDTLTPSTSKTNLQICLDSIPAIVESLDSRSVSFVRMWLKRMKVHRSNPHGIHLEGFQKTQIPSNPFPPMPA